MITVLRIININVIFRTSITFIIPPTAYITKVDGAYVYSCNSGGMYTKSFDNGSFGCVPCTECPKGFKVALSCRYNRDTICEKCPPETFVTESGEDCQQCARCPPGYYIHEQCLVNQDRRCRTCAKGYFSHQWNSLFCRRCKRCRQKENVMRPCNGSSNFICGDCDNDHYRESSTGDCVPCSRCQGEKYVTVTECIEKRGEQSEFVCQPQIYFPRLNDSQTQTETHSKPTDVDSTSGDSLVVSFTSMMVIGLAIFILCGVILFQWMTRKVPTPCRDPETLTLVDEESVQKHASHVLNPDSKIVSLEESKSPCLQSSENGAYSNSEQQNDFQNHQNEKIALMKRVNISPRSPKKKRKRKLRYDYVQSEPDLAKTNRYAMLGEASVYTL